LAGRELITYITVQLDRLGLLDEQKILKRDFPIKPMDNEKKLKLMLSMAQRKKEVVLISDLYDFDENQIKKLRVQRHMHLFKTVTPFDYAKSFPFTLWGMRQEEKVFMPRVLLAAPPQPPAGKMDNKLHLIDLSQGHLDQLIKEMA
jgi:hypothetical protein